MGMLERIKKKQIPGFKEFVQNLETSRSGVREQIAFSGMLEDPLYMSWVRENLVSFEDFFSLPSDDMILVLNHQEQVLQVFAKSLFNQEKRIQELALAIPKLIGKLKDELSYLKEVSSHDQESAKLFILKLTRKLQEEEKIQGFRWSLPPAALFHPLALKDGPSETVFRSGSLALKGDIFKGKRKGKWQHFYESGGLLGEGEYDQGMKLGEWTFYGPKGNLKAQGNYKLDEKDGLWKEWDKKGVVEEFEYQEGVRKNQSSSK